MVFHWSWFRKDVVFCERRQSIRNLGQTGGKDVVGIRRERMSNFPCYKPIVQRSTQKKKHGELSQISSVFTEQSQRSVKNVNPIKIDQGNFLW